MRLRLTTKLAEVIDGVDLSHCAEGDVIELSEQDARLLMAEKWAEPVEDSEEVTCFPRWLRDRDVAADQGRPLSTAVEPSSEANPRDEAKA
jgi:hypothetical protein